MNTKITLFRVFFIVCIIFIGCSKGISKAERERRATFSNTGAVLCPNSNCLAVGHYRNIYGGKAPFISFAEVDGLLNNNTQPIPRSQRLRDTPVTSPRLVGVLSTSAVTLPDDAASGPDEFAGLSTISCTQENCIAVGYYEKIHGGRNPLVTYSNDAASTFISSPSIVMPADALVGPKEDAEFHGLSCFDLRCIAVGYYKNNAGSYLPLISMSRDGGRSFTELKTLELPLDAAKGNNANAVLLGITCNRDSCYAVGYYETFVGGCVPLLAVSVNGGQSFVSTTEVKLPEDAATGVNANAALVGLSCVESKCTAVGFYNTVIGATAPLLGTSYKQGRAYKTTSLVSLPEDAAAENEMYAVLSGVSCFGTNCIAVGYYDNDGGGREPLFSISIDSGETFAIRSNSHVSLPPDASIEDFKLAAFGPY